MAEAALPQNVPGIYEPSLFGTYSKKIGMWLFLLSDSLTFGALLYAYSYGRVSTPNWPTPFHSESIVNATIMTAFLLTSSLTMVLAVNAAARGNDKARVLWLLATMACGLGFIVLHAKEWSNLITEGLRLPIFPAVPNQQVASEFVDILFALWLVAWLATPAYSPFHYGAHVLLIAALVCSLILWLKPKVYDAADVEVAGLYWHFVDLVWMFIFPLVYIMSTKIT